MSNRSGVLAWSILLVGGAVAPAQVPKPAVPAHDLLLEAEEFQVVKGPWKVIGLGENYYAATLSNVFISRQKLLSAPEQCDAAEAVRNANIPADGKYRVWTRYECPSNWAIEHTLRIEQKGKVIFERKYGAVSNPKLWPFGKGIVPMVEWDWGSGDNVVWEPGDPVALVKGPAKFTLLAGKQPADQPRGGAAKRNIDCIYLTTGTDFGIRDANKQSWHVLDRVLNQQGECYIRITNPAGAASPLSVKLDVKTHNPYWQPRGLLPPFVCVAGGQEPKKDADWTAPGQSSPWVAVGQALDTTNMQELIVSAQYKVPPGKQPPAGADFVVELARDAAGKQLLRRVAFKHPEVPSLILEIPHDLRGKAPVIRTLEEWHEDLLGYLKGLPPRGKVPTKLPVYGIMGARWHGWPAKTPDRFYQLRTETGLLLGRNTWTKGDVPADLEKKYGVTYGKNLEHDVRSIPTPQLTKYLQDKKTKGELDQVLIFNFGDEIGVGGFDSKKAEDNAEFRAYLKQMKAPVNADAAKLTNDPKADPKLYYWSQMFSIDRGIAQLKERTQIVEQVMGKGVYTGANYSPHPQYWPHAGQWVRLFRQRAMTMPWSEDWTFQIPEPSMMTAGYLCDVFRCAGREHNMPIHFYTMPHSPGQTARDFTLSFYSALAHGNKVLNFFAAVPIYDYTENYVSWQARDNWKAIRDVVHDVGQADDLIWEGKVRPAQVAMIISHVNDIWEQARGSSIYNFERKNLYCLLRRFQVPVDFVTEEDIAEGKVNDYKVLLLCGDHMLGQAAKALRGWVERGGILLSVAGGGFRDEYDAPLDTLKEVLGVKDAKLTLTERSCFVKEELAWLKPLAGIPAANDPSGQIPALAALQELTPTDGAKVTARFADGRPALVENRFKAGNAYLFAFFPGSAFMQSGIPRRPFDRGTSEFNFNHFLPTGHNEDAARLVLQPFIWRARKGLHVDAREGEEWPSMKDQLSLDISVIDAPGGVVVPIANYTGKDIKQLTVRLRAADKFSRIYAARAGDLQAKRQGEYLIVQLPLGWVDLIVFRK